MPRSPNQVTRYQRDAYVTPPRTPSGLVRHVARNVLNYGAQHLGKRAAQNVLKYSVKRIRSKFSNKRKSSMVTRDLGGPMKKFRTSKPKVISNRLRGVNKKFANKVNKVINHRDAWGEYIYWGQKRLRQIFRDQWTYDATDQLNVPITIGGMVDIRDASSVLWNTKTMASDFTNGTSNLDKEIPIMAMYAGIDFFFRSTSSHVVNIELFECTAKESNDNSAFDWMNSTFDDYINEWKFGTGLAATTDRAVMGVEARHMTSLHKYYRVKVHKIKLDPGSYCTRHIIACRNKTFDGSQEMTNGSTTSKYPKGTKSFFFRVINDITVSATGTISGRAGDIHNWPSNEKGGVAMRYRKTYRIAPPKVPATSGTPNYRNVVKIFQSFLIPDDEKDQQVSFENPVTTANTDNT